MGNRVGRQYFAAPSIDLTEFIRGKRVCIDGYLFIYKYCAVYRTQKGELFHGKNDLVTSHIFGLFPFLVRLKQYCSEIIFVFEGPAPFVKYVERMQRAIRKDEAKIKYKDAIARKLPDSVIANYKKQTFVVTPGILASCKTLLELSGISYVFAEHEGEKCCELLIKRGYVDYVISDDWDCLMLEIPVLLRKLVFKNERVYGELIEKPKKLHELGLTADQLIKIILISGCDYTSGIPDVGPITAYKLVKEDVLHIKYPTHYHQVIDLQSRLSTAIDIPIQVHCSDVDIAKLKLFLLNDCELDYKLVYRYLQILSA